MSLRNKSLKHMLIGKNILKLLVFWLLIFHLKIFSSSSETGAAKGKKFYYEADEIQYLPKSKHLLLKNNVIFLYKEIFFSANKVEIFHKKHLVVAEGNVSILHKKERILAQKLIFNLQNKKMRLDHVEITLDDTDSKEISGLNENEIRLYNISKAELLYENERVKRSEEINNKLLSLQKQYSWFIENQIEEKDKIDDIINSYSKLLERSLRSSQQKNKALLRLPKNLRQKLIKRRETIKKFQSKSDNSQSTFFNMRNIKGHLSIFAERVFRNDDSIYKLEKATISSCKCQEDDGFKIWNLKAN